MTSERTPGHPSDLELAAWVDEPGAAGIPAHVEGCARCRDRIAELVATRTAIALLGRTDRPTPGAGPAPEAVVAEAEAAAEEAAAIALDEEALDAALAAAEPVTPAAPVERSASIEAEFALLTDAEQAAILRELERTDFDL